MRSLKAVSYTHLAVEKIQQPFFCEYRVVPHRILPEYRKMPFHQCKHILIRNITASHIFLNNFRSIITCCTWLRHHNLYFVWCGRSNISVSYTHLSPAESRPFFNKFKISRRIGSASAFNVSCIPNNSSHPFI